MEELGLYGMECLQSEYVTDTILQLLCSFHSQKSLLLSRYESFIFLIVLTHHKVFPK